MLRSKSRNGFLEFGKKSQKSAISRTISASKMCRGDPLISQIDATALKPLDRNSSTGVTSSEFLVQLNEELKMTKALLEVAEQEKDRAIDELREMKMEIEVSKQIDARLAEKDMLIDGLEVELSIFKASKAAITDSLSESKRRIKELEKEVEKTKVCKNKTKLENSENYEMKLLEMELENVKQEGEQNSKLLDKANRETELYKNTIERLRLEADESPLSWNEREIGFVKCVKEAEDERTRTQQENIRLVESLKSANSTIEMLKEENIKLKIALKQATGIPKIENSLQLDEDLDYVSQEIRKLSVKEMNRPLIVATVKQGAKTKSMKTVFDESKKGKIHKNRSSFDLSEIKSKVEDEVPVKAEILDIADTPKLVTRRASFSFMNGETCVHPDDLKRHEVSDLDSSGNGWIQKRRTFMQSFEDLIKGISVEKEEKSVE